MNVSKYLRLFAAGSVAMLAVVGAVACGGGEDEEVFDPGAQAKSPASGGTPSGSGAAAESIKVIMKDNLFEPKTLTVTAGKSVQIELKNEGQAVHNMHVLSAAQEGKDFSSAATINPGAENKFTIKLNKKGTYNFQCDYHLPDMVGTITVQ